MNTELQQKTGLNCPVCGAFIPATITQLITVSSLSCSHCGLRLDIDREASRKAIDALTKVRKAQDIVQKSSKFNY
ncbi:MULTISPECIES: hypothetical protein [unclassified Bacteroides]|mgnify:FL=1|jgi:transcription elongation factor Elf1|uniref:hypothetical protein n=1 Tax=unclassified Bacteroides TaxID=2646097 RepID=UPI000E8D129D|nr:MULTISPECIES: hypothetical protein [unclassified Bacteroides]RGN51175.1 hypothetical protein DXB63_00130 [Bacteroides sp. OM05-12]RHR78710.1 hypothetical protein DWW69_04605 [Bacteroides sp. AF16-49]